MSSEIDLEMGPPNQTKAKTGNAPSGSSGGTTRPQNAQDTSNNATHQPGDTHRELKRPESRVERASSMEERKMPVGYPRLAYVMGRRPNAGIYRRFGYLNAQNLLYMQAELVCLEERLQRLQSDDSRHIVVPVDGTTITEDKETRRALDWEALSKSIPTSSELRREGGDTSHQGKSCCGHKRCEEWCCGEKEPHEHCDQWNLAMKIREKLHRYNEALIQQMTLASAGAPNSYDLEWIQDFLNSSEHSMKGALLGKDQLLWGNKGSSGERKNPAHDLVALVPPPKRDLFSEWISETLVKWILNRKQLWHGSGTATSAVTATMPIMSIVVLHFTSDGNVRLALLAVFNLLAAFILYIFTDAQPMQVFAASAAYSAVNIVFIGSHATVST